MAQVGDSLFSGRGMQQPSHSITALLLVEPLTWSPSSGYPDQRDRLHKRWGSGQQCCCYSAPVDDKAGAR